MQKSRPFYLLFVVLMVLALSLAACSDKKKDKEKTPTSTPAATEKFEVTPEATEPTGTLAPVTGDPVNGKALFASAGCATCHNVDTDADKTGPSLKGLGTEAAEGEIDGHPALDYLHQSIVDPGAVLVEGFQNLMPSFKDTLTEAQIQDLIAYLLTLTE